MARRGILFSVVFIELLTPQLSRESALPLAPLDPRVVEKSELSWIEKQGSLFKQGQLFSGILVERYLNGALYKESHYENGKKEGMEKEYALNGIIQGLWHYHLGKKEGDQQGWFAEGPKKFNYHYQKGLLEGEQLEWHQNGTVFRRQVFHQGVETEKKILFQGSEVFSNYVQKDKRKYGVDGGTLCFEVKKDGEK